METNLPVFVRRIEGSNAIIPMSYANAIISNKKNLYKIVDSHGIFLPNLKDRAVTCEWLFRVLANSVFTIRKSQTSSFPQERMNTSKIDLIEKISNCLGNGVTLGNHNSL